MNSTPKAKQLKTRFLIALIFIFGVFVTKGADSFTINLNNISNNPLSYCSDPVLVAPNITITSLFQITGMKVSISFGYIPGEDQLTYSGSISYQWYSDQGYLLLQGTSSTTFLDYQNAIRTINYINSNKSNPTLGAREITITLGDADYLPFTGHFYKYVPQNGIFWTAAKAAAEASNYFGLQGYLATITSAEENIFISQKTKGTGWIGASDAAKEGDWRWVTGPEGKEDNLQGRLFWRGTGADYIARKIGAGPILGQYSNWNTNEPNNSGGNENYAHILYQDGSSGYRLWNDLGDMGVQDTTQIVNGQPYKVYYPRGYLVEYGGMPGDPDVQLSATVNLQVNTISFNTKAIAPICAGESETLNQPRDNGTIPVTYSWTPAATLSDASAANPVATPLIPTIYTVNANRNGSCPISHDFTVPVNPKPIIDLSVDSKTCYGYNLEVLDKGDVNAASSTFTWTYGGNTVISGLGINSATIPLGVDQSNRDLTLLVVDKNTKCQNQKTVSNILVKPALSPFTVKDPVLCLPDLFEFSVTPDPAVITYNWNFGDGTSGEGLTPTHKYQKSQKYDIQLTVTNKDNCTNTAVIKDMVFAAPVPVAAFSLSDSIIYTNKPNVNFLDASSLATKWDWDFGDGTLGSGENPPGHNYKGTGRRTVSLKVTSEFNCTDTVSHHLLIAFDRIFPPNGFSPNAPNAIDRVFLLNSEGVKPAGYHFIVLSRWDDIVFEAKDEIKGWDGRMKDGSFAPAGTYLWVLNYLDFLDQKHRQTGSVTVVY